MSADVSSHIIDHAITWMVKLGSGTADAQLVAACEAWRAEDPSHEQAWQRLQASEQAFRALPDTTGALAVRTLEAARRRRGFDPQRRRALKTLGLGAGAVLVGKLASESSSWQRVTADYSTAVGERRVFDLADGTQLRLNTDSAVDIEYTSRQRLITLRQGEIFVRTAHEPGAASHRPLRVSTPLGLLEALGTSFFVRQETNRVRLKVTEGSVMMSGGAALAAAGEEFLIDGQGPRRVPAPTFDITGWIDGALVAKKMRLQDFLGELGRYRRGWLRCDRTVADWRVSGVFQLDDMDEALQALTRALAVRVRRIGPYWVTIAAAHG